MSIRVIKAGVLDSIQDAGRFGWQFLGVNPSGVMDRFSSEIANMLVGNDPGEVVIELHFPASIFLFEEPSLVAIAGADLSASVNGEPVPVLHPVLVNKGTVIQFHRYRSGARVCLAIHGGIVADEWLGSRSTQLQVMAGGFHGRALRKDDQIDLKKNTFAPLDMDDKDFVVLPWRADVNWRNEGETGDVLYVLPGHEWDWITQESKDEFLSTLFTVTQQSDRMGYKLKNAPLILNRNDELISSPVSFGTIQLLPNGQLIILMADHQTAGGYPRIAHIISADHSKAAQLKAGDEIRFKMTGQHEAENLFFKQQQHLHQLQNACKFRLEEFFGE